MPPFTLPPEAGVHSKGTLAGYVSMTVLPQHVSSPEKIEKLAWALLILQAHLQASIKEFKVRHARCGSPAAMHQQAWLHPRSSPVSNQERLEVLATFCSHPPGRPACSHQGHSNVVCLFCKPEWTASLML